MYKGTEDSTKSRTGPGTRTFGTLLGGMPYLSLGAGEPLIYVPGLGPHNEPPVGLERSAQAQQLAPFAARRRVWWINRRPGLAPDATMADLALDYADALRLKFSGPVDVMGVSTGGSVALQLAADHPDVVRRLVIVSAAYRLGRHGAIVQRNVAREIQAGRPRWAAAEMMGALGTVPRTQRMLRAVGWMIGRAMFGKATPDMIATINAEDSFDLKDRLHEISAPTLVIGGQRDPFYSEGLFRDTAQGIPNGRVLIYRGKGHLATSSSANVGVDVLDFLNGRTVGSR